MEYNLTQKQKQLMCSLADDYGEVTIKVSTKARRYQDWQSLEDLGLVEQVSVKKGVANFEVTNLGLHLLSTFYE